MLWEYVNPYFGGPPSALNNRVFRACRCSARRSLEQERGEALGVKKFPQCRKMFNEVTEHVYSSVSVQGDRGCQPSSQFHGGVVHILR